MEKITAPLNPILELHTTFPCTPAHAREQHQHSDYGFQPGRVLFSVSDPATPEEHRDRFQIPVANTFPYLVPSNATTVQQITIYEQAENSIFLPRPATQLALHETQSKSTEETEQEIFAIR